MKGHTVKSNARRAARKAGLDPDTLDFVQDADGLWTWIEAPAAASPAPALDDLIRTNIVAGKRQTAFLMLARPEGATLTEIAAETGLQAHSVRGRISDTSRTLGLVVATEAVEGRGRVYRISLKEDRTDG